MSKVLKSVEGRTLTFDDGSTLSVEAGVHVKLDGQSSSLDALKAGDRCEELTDVAGGALVCLKVCRDVPEGAQASTAPGSTDGTDSFERPERGGEASTPAPAGAVATVEAAQEAFLANRGPVLCRRADGQEWRCETFNEAQHFLASSAPPPSGKPE